jgi:hypothetical protein
VDGFPTLASEVEVGPMGGGASSERSARRSLESRKNNNKKGVRTVEKNGEYLTVVQVNSGCQTTVTAPDEVIDDQQ